MVGKVRWLGWMVTPGQFIQKVALKESYVFDVTTVLVQLWEKEIMSNIWIGVIGVYLKFQGLLEIILIIPNFTF